MIDINTELTVQDTMQRILNKIDDELDLITGNLEKGEDKDAPPMDIRAARVINELCQSYAYLSKNTGSQKNINV